MLEILADEAQKALRFAGEEAARSAAPAAVSAAFAGATGVSRVITGKIKVLRADPRAATAKIIQVAEGDAEFEHELYLAGCTTQKPPGGRDRSARSARVH